MSFDRVAAIYDATREHPEAIGPLIVDTIVSATHAGPDTRFLEIGVGTGAGAVAAMEKGEIDAISNLDPVLTQLESTGKFVAVADSRTEKGMKDIYGGDYHASVIYITDEFIKKYPNTVQAVVNAMVRADKWIAKATPQEIVDLMPAEYKAGSPPLYKEALLKNMIGYSENGEMSMKAAENTL